MVLKKKKNIKKVIVHKTGQKITENSSPDKSDRCENILMGLDIMDLKFPAKIRNK